MARKRLSDLLEGLVWFLVLGVVILLIGTFNIYFLR